MADDWNSRIIEEFRANHGEVGGPFAGRDLLLLSTIGAKTGRSRTTPLAFVRDGDTFVIVASNAGAPTNPDWYHNIRVNPEVTVEIGAETVNATATPITEGPERDCRYAAMVRVMPGFAEYQEKTDRVIPVVILTTQ
ncbi:nitroreductase family deazaflavin-dependent oxidoreductase [Nocardia sp. NPDC049190]|uniref:nitroreductase family deazaflavin-dependent oxidoreductase n=1 Tax=Nocardia sp. NPDC049190 TaxID=3155650 RepID=UPI00340A6C89